MPEEIKHPTAESEDVALHRTCSAWMMDVYHVLCAKTGEQRFEQRAEGSEEQKAVSARAMAWADSLLELGHGACDYLENERDRGAERPGSASEHKTMNTTQSPFELGCIRFVRLVVTVFLPWIALRKAKRQLHLAACIMRNEAMAAFRPENTTLIRWADECEHDGWTICKPYDTPEYRK